MTNPVPPASSPGPVTSLEWALRDADGVIYTGANEGVRWTREQAEYARDADDELLCRTVTTTEAVVGEWQNATSDSAPVPPQAPAVILIYEYDQLHDILADTPAARELADAKVAAIRKDYNDTLAGPSKDRSDHIRWVSVIPAAEPRPHR